MLPRLLILCAASFLNGTAFAAEPKDLAALFPAGTLAYAEVGQPVAAADSIAAFTKGTLLADSLGFSHDRRDKLRPPAPSYGLKKAGEWSLFTSPEMLAEFKRFRGIAAALTGFDPKTGRPSLAVAFVLGESNMAGLLARQYLLTAENIRRVGKVDGVAVYQNRGLTGAIADENRKVEPDDDPAPAQGSGEFTYLYVPGLFVIGSSLEAVGDVYRRFAGTEKSASFAASPQLKTQVEARKKPGVFFCAGLDAFDSQLIAAKKSSKAEWLKSPAVSYIRFLLNPQQVEAFSGSLQLRPDGWAISATAEVKAGGTCPLLALLSGGEVNLAEADAFPAAIRLAFPPKEKRAKAILDAADAIARALGEAGGLPSELVAEADKKGFKLAGDWLPLVRSAALFNPAAAGPNAKPAHAVLVLALEDAAAAKAWLGIVPRVSQVFSGAEKFSDPASETIQNVKVWGLVHDGISFHYAVAGTKLILGHDRDGVAAVANAPATPGAKAEGDPALLFRLAFAKAWEGERDRNNHTLPFPVDVNAKGIIEKEWTQALAAMPALTFQAKGSGQTLTIRFAQKDLKKPLAKWLELLWRNIEQTPEHDQSGRIHGGILQLDDVIQFRRRFR